MARSRAVRRRQPVLVRIVATLGILIVVVALLIGAVVALFPSSNLFASARAALVEGALAAYLGAPVEIDGAVTIALGQTVRVTGENIRVERPEDTGSGHYDRLEHGEVAISLSGLLSGRFDMTDLKLQGVALADNSALFHMDRAPTAEGSFERRWFGVLPGLVRLSARTDIAISDATYSYSNPTSGWVFEILVPSIVNDRNESTGETTLSIDGSVNGTAFKIVGETRSVAEGGSGGGDAFTVTASSTGASVTVKSTVPDGPDPDLRDLALQVDIASLGDMLDLLKIARTIEGSASFAATIRPDGQEPEVKDIDSTITIQHGPTIAMTGSLEDLDARSGVDVEVSAEWPDAVADQDEQEGLLAFDIYNVDGRLTGDLNDLVLSEGWITTNLFSEAIPGIGPISARAIRRQDDGRIAVEGLRVLAGPANARTFDLTGQVGDLLTLSDYSLSGNILLPVVEVLRISADEAALGYLSGTFAVSDASGVSGIDTLDASITGSDLVSAKVHFETDQSSPPQAASYDLTFAVPDYARFADVLGLRPQTVGAIDFDGTLKIASESGDLDGKLTFGKMVATGDLGVKPQDGRPLITGNVSSQSLSLADLRTLFAVQQDMLALRRKAIDARRAGGPPPGHTPSDHLASPLWDVNVSAGRLETGGGSVSALSGRIGYDRGVVSAKPLRLTYGKGVFDFTGQMHVREPSRPFSVEGHMKNWPIADVLKDLDINLPVSGVLQADFNVSSSGTTQRQAIDAASGKLYLRLLNGVIGNRLIDLAGLVLPSWLTAPSAKSGESKIECFSAKLDFHPGLATLDRAVVETDEVIVTATGRIDFKDDTINIEAVPKALRPNLVPIVSPFAIRGPLSAPKVEVKGGVVGRGIAETLALPFNTLGTLLGVDKSGPKPRQPAEAC